MNAHHTGAHHGDDESAHSMLQTEIQLPSSPTHYHDVLSQCGGDALVTMYKDDV
jgi:hypothetical protein